jgi:hypothetical protein
MGAIVRARLDLNLEHDLMDFVGDIVDVDVELDVDLRLDLPLENRRAVRALDRQILDILGEDGDLRGAVRSGAIVRIDGVLFGHEKSVPLELLAAPGRCR